MGGRVKSAILVSVLMCGGAAAQQQKVGAPPEASNMKLVGYNDLQARSAYQPTIHHQGDRWIAYIGHHGGTDEIPSSGQSDDRQGRAERHLDRRRHRSRKSRNICGTFPGRKANTNPAARRWCASATARPCRRATRTRSICSEPSAAPRMRSGTSPIPPIPCWSRRSAAGLKDTHKNWWECDTGIAYLVSGAPDWRTRRMTQVYDLSRSRAPREDQGFRFARTGAGLDRRGADRAARADLARTARQPRLFRLRHQQGRLHADRRSREASRPDRRSRPRTICACPRFRAWRCRRSTAHTRCFR